MFPDKFQEKSVTALKVLKWFHFEVLGIWGPFRVYLYTQLPVPLVHEVMGMQENMTSYTVDEKENTSGSFSFATKGRGRRLEELLHSRAE